MQPNILLVVLDAARKDYLSCYDGKGKETPHIDALAERSTIFENAYSTAPWTPPSHASMFTGKYPSQHRVYGSSPELSDKNPVLAETLQEFGYKTYGLSNSFHTSRKRGFARGFDYYHDLTELRTIADKRVEPSIDYMEYVIKFFLNGDSESYFQTEKLITALSRDARPFFGFININTAHYPYSPPQRFDGFFDDLRDDPEIDAETVRSLAQGDGFNTYMMGEIDASEKELEALRSLYASEVAYGDELVGKIVQYLKSREEFDNTLIIVTSDHGELLGEEQKIGHQFSVNDRLLNVPLVVKVPHSSQTGEVDQLVSLIDLYPTILDKAIDGETPDMVGNNLFSSQSHDVVFAEYNRPFPPIRERLYERFGDTFEPFDTGFQVALNKSWKMDVDSNGTETFYRLDAGDQEAAEPPRSIQAELRDALDEKLVPLPGETEAEELDQRTRGHLEDLGYL
jgi:arylsulfatase A-like enzyme